jgi:hypothetical protein
VKCSLSRRPGASHRVGVTMLYWAYERAKALTDDPMAASWSRIGVRTRVSGDDWRFANRWSQHLSPPRIQRRIVLFDAVDDEHASCSRGVRQFSTLTGQCTDRAAQLQRSALPEHPMDFRAAFPRETGQYLCSICSGQNNERKKNCTTRR